MQREDALTTYQDNVLISGSGIPQICDFGISRILAASETHSSKSSGNLRGSTRWMAIELLKITDSGPHPKHTLETDVWAFGMTIHVRMLHSICSVSDMSSGTPYARSTLRKY